VFLPNPNYKDITVSKHPSEKALRV
jgi:hypothetical protein